MIAYNKSRCPQTFEKCAVTSVALGAQRAEAARLARTRAA
jgi:hypothetical protein